MDFSESRIVSPVDNMQTGHKNALLSTRINPPNVKFAHTRQYLVKTNIASPPEHVFVKLRPLLQRFVSSHKTKLMEQKTFVVTIANVDGVDCILLCTENAKKFEFNDNFEEFSMGFFLKFS
jgi:hypothetical protein